MTVFFSCLPVFILSSKAPRFDVLATGFGTDVDMGGGGGGGGAGGATGSDTIVVVLELFVSAGITDTFLFKLASDIFFLFMLEVEMLDVLRLIALGLSLVLPVR